MLLPCAEVQPHRAAGMAVDKYKHSNVVHFPHWLWHALNIYNKSETYIIISIVCLHLTHLPPALSSLLTDLQLNKSSPENKCAANSALCCQSYATLSATGTSHFSCPYSVCTADMPKCIKHVGLSDIFKCGWIINVPPGSHVCNGTDHRSVWGKLCSAVTYDVHLQITSFYNSYGPAVHKLGQCIATLRFFSP